MSEVQEAVSIEVARRRSLPAVAVRELRKEFKLRDRKKGGSAAARGSRSKTFRSRSSGARRSPSSARTVGSTPSSACCRRCCPRRRLGGDLRKRRGPRRLPRASAREPRVGRGLVLQEDVGRREPELRGPLLRDDRRPDARFNLEILGRVGFPSDRSDESMENLSRGMQQKVALARALLTSPVVLLLDEPTTGLDPRSKLEVQDFIREIRSNHDSTILLCTHDLAEAEVLAERVGILDRGRLLVLESADALKSRYGADTLEEAVGGDGARVRGGGRRGRRPGGDGVSTLGTTRGVRRRRRRRRAQLLPDEALHLVGPRLVHLDRREHAHDRLHREGHRGPGRRAGRQPSRRACSIGAVVWAYSSASSSSSSWRRWPGSAGGNDRVHVHGALRPMHLAGMGVFSVLYGLLRAIFLFTVCVWFFDLSVPDGVHGRPRRPRDRLDLVPRDRDDDVGASAGSRRRRGRSRGGSPRGRCSSSRVSTTRWRCWPTDAVAREDLARDVRARGGQGW